MNDGVKMTTDEAIEILEEWREYTCDSNCEQCDECHEVKLQKALDMAILALRKQDEFNDYCDALLERIDELLDR